MERIFFFFLEFKYNRIILELFNFFFFFVRGDLLRVKFYF